MKTAGEFKVGYWPELDGIRALAVGLVLLAHCGVRGFDPTAGAVGVSTFFALSGFLITALLLKERAEHERVDLRAFWRRRFFRLVPALILLLVVVTPILMIGDFARPGRWGTLAIIFYAGNWFMIGGGSISPFTHTWSLSVEEQFYILWPIFLGIMKYRKSILMTTIVIAVVSVIWRLFLWTNSAETESLRFRITRVYYGTDTSIGLLLAGCIVAMIYHRRVHLSISPNVGRLAVIGLLIVAGVPALFNERLGTYLMGPTWKVAISGVLTVLLTVVVIIWLVEHGSRFWSMRPLVMIGRVSYGIYLWHYPIVMLMTKRIGPINGRILPTVVVILLTGVCSSLSWILLEKPMLRFKHRASAMSVAS